MNSEAISSKRGTTYSTKRVLFLALLILTSMLTISTSLPRASADSITGSPLDVGLQPLFMAFDHAGTFAYVVNDGISISKINVESNSVVATLSSLGAKQIAINQIDTFAYLTNNDQKKITKIDLGTFSIVGTITLSGSSIQPWAIDLNSSGDTAYVVDINSNNFYTIDTSSFTIVDTQNFSPLSLPRSVHVDPTNQYAYIGSSDKISKIDLVNYSVVSTFVTGGGNQSIILNALGTVIYFTRTYTVGSFHSLDLSTGAIRNGPVDTYLTSFAINSAETFAYLAYNQQLIKVNLETMTEVSRTDATLAAGSISFVKFNNLQTMIYGLVPNNPSNGRLIRFSITVAPDPQTITFEGLPSKLSSASPFSLSATSSSGLAITFTSRTPAICSVNSRTVTVIKVGECTINADQAGGSGWAEAARVSQSFVVLPAPPSGEPGVSINSGGIYTNSKIVKLNLVWPEYATEARVSNDGGFLASLTSTIQLASAVDWSLEDSLAGEYEKTVYVRFSGSGIDTTKTYSDDIVLDTIAPIVNSVSATASLGKVEVGMKATDDITGPDKVEIRNGSLIVSAKYSPLISFTEKEIGLSITSSGIRKLDSPTIEIRISDKAGNWSAYQVVPVVKSAAGPVAAPVVTMKKSLIITMKKSITAKSIASYAKLKTPSSSKISLKVLRSSSKYCKIVGLKLQAVKAGSCKVTVTVSPKKGKPANRTVTLKVIK